MSAPKPGAPKPSGSASGGAGYAVRDPQPTTGKPFHPPVTAATISSSSGGGSGGGAAVGGAMPRSERLVSIDALRGFDMFWIVGGQTLIFALGALAMALAGPWLPENSPWVAWLQNDLPAQAKHADWLGFTAQDLIMPLFLFMAGVSMPFSFAKRKAIGQSIVGVYRHIFVRVVVLWLFGMIAQGNLLTCNPEKFQLFSNTLQAIAVGYFFAAIAVLHFPKIVQAILAALLLIGYWLLLRLVPFGAHAPGTIEPAANLAIHIDRLLLADFMDPKTTYAWILAGMTFTSTVLLGAMAGHVLRSERSGTMKTLWLLLWGVGCLALGWLWAGGFDGLEQLGKITLVGEWKSPVIKHLWTSSMVLWAGGWSFLLMALFYLVLDVWRIRLGSGLFVVIGANAILAYMLTRDIVPFRAIAKTLVGGAADQIRAWGAAAAAEAPTNFSAAAGPAADTLVALVAFGILWIILSYMYRKGTFLRV